MRIVASLAALRTFFVAVGLTALTGQVASADTPAPIPNDITFVSTQGSGWVCGGTVYDTIYTTRYAGSVDQAGHLENAKRLVGKGLLCAQAELEIAVSGVHPVPLVYLNGRYLGVVSSGEGFSISRFKVPIEDVVFPPEPGTGPGVPPDTASSGNALEIRADGMASVQLRWSCLRIKAMSPVVLIHGNSMTGAWYRDHGFTIGLDASPLLCDYSIDFNPAANSIEENAKRLDGRVGFGLEDIAKRFGVDSVHLVAHSKGGLDARGYLEKYYIPTVQRQLRILSLTTLSTPHDGSPLADAMDQRQTGLTGLLTYHSFAGVGLQQSAAFRIRDWNRGYHDLTTRFCARFNRHNVPALWSRRLQAAGPGTRYFTLSPDMDLNGSGGVDTMAEVRDMRMDEPKLEFIPDSELPGKVNVVYQTMRSTRAFAVTRGAVWVDSVGATHTMIAVKALPTAGPIENDTLVQMPSGLGLMSRYWTLVGGSMQLRLTGGRNHSSVGDANVARKIIPWIVTTERTCGDLR